MPEAYNKPLPQIDALNRPFWDSTRRGKLSLQVCEACRDTHYPPSPVCPNCLSPDQEWVEASGEGVLESWVDFHRAYWPGFQDELPYRVALVRLAEGPLFLSYLVGDSEKARRGAVVRTIFEAVTTEVTLPKFVLA